MIALTGVRPTGELHLGNYFGAIKPLLDLQEKYVIFLFVADLHSLTTSCDIDTIKGNSQKLLAAFRALGFDPQKTIIWVQSAIPEVCELMYILSALTGFQYLHKGHAFKTACLENKNPTVALFLYPVLMAADILAFQADLVPVGVDQKQHLEICRDLAEKLRNMFGVETKIPEPLIMESTCAVPGVDGRKMSKSYKNTLPIFASVDEIVSIVRQVKTDSTPLGSPLNLENSVLGSYIKLLSKPEDYEKIKKEALAGNYGWGKIKEFVIELFLSKFSYAREKYVELLSDPAELLNQANEGAKIAKERARDFLGSILKRLNSHV